MSILVNFNGTQYAIPTAGETGWATTVTNYLADVGSNALTATSTATLLNKTIGLLDGTAAAPSLNFATDADTGIYHPGAGQLGIAVDGVSRATFDNTGLLTLAGGVSAPTVTTPAINSSSALVLSTGGTARFQISNTGAVTWPGATSVTFPAGTTFTGSTLTNPTINSPTISAGTINNTVIGNTTPALGTFAGLTSTTNLTITGLNNGIELGPPGTAGTPWIDFHSSGGAARDYDVRLSVTGGNTGSDGQGVLNVAASGGVSVTGSVNATAGLSSTQAGLAQFISADATWGYFGIGNAYQLRFERASGALYYYNGSSNVIGIGASGNMWWNGDPYWSVFVSGPNRILSFANTWYWGWNTGTGDLTWAQGGNGAGFVWRVSDGLSYSARGPGGGNGAYTNISDASLKTAITEAPHGLAEVCALTPATFRRTDAAVDRTELGFTAQDVRGSIPEAVIEIEHNGAPVLAVQSEAIVAALVGAVKQLAGEVAALKARLSAA